MREPGVFLSAGEPSGDMHAAELARALRERIPGVRLVGVGGERMAAEGVELLAGLDRLAILGFTGVVPRLPDLARVRREVRRRIDRDIQLFVPVDYSGFNLPLAGYAHRRGLPVIYYVAPQVWAWRPGRARRLAERTDLVCTILPFERPLLERYGVRARFVGHPLLDRRGDRSQQRAPEAPVLGLFPGSRRQEVRRMLPLFLATGRAVERQRPGLAIRVARAPGLPRELFRGCDPNELSTPAVVRRQAQVALTKAGTITLELALARVPMVVAYRMGSVNFRIVRQFVRVEHISLVNLVAGRPVVPELVQDEARPAVLASHLRRLLDETERREEMVAAFREIESRLGSPGVAGRVADECARRLRRAP